MCFVQVQKQYLSNYELRATAADTAALTVTAAATDAAACTAAAAAAATLLQLQQYRLWLLLPWGARSGAARRGTFGWRSSESLPTVRTVQVERDAVRSRRPCMLAREASAGWVTSTQPPWACRVMGHVVVLSVAMVIDGGSGGGGAAGAGMAACDSAASSSSSGSSSSGSRSRRWRRREGMRNEEGGKR